MATLEIDWQTARPEASPRATPQSLSVIVPALNEERHLREAVGGLVAALGENRLDWEVIIVNDGSKDKTGTIAEELARGESRIKVVHHQKRQGVGCCFRDGLKVASKDAVTWFPGDGENDPHELIKFYPLLAQVDIVAPFVLNLGIRSWGRRALSMIYLWVINFSFGTVFSYTNGNVLYRRRVLEAVKPQSSGLFFNTECLVKAVRQGFVFASVPVRLRKRAHGRSKALSPKSVWSVGWDFLRLFTSIHVLARFP